MLFRFIRYWFDKVFIPKNIGWSMTNGPKAYGGANQVHLFAAHISQIVRNHAASREGRVELVPEKCVPSQGGHTIRLQAVVVLPGEEGRVTATYEQICPSVRCGDCKREGPEGYLGLCARNVAGDVQGYFPRATFEQSGGRVVFSA
jgi:hypothetical protein